MAFRDSPYGMWAYLGLRDPAGDIFGLGPYGLTPTVSLSAAFAISTHGVRILLTGVPKHDDAFGQGDATNPATWTVTNDTRGVSLVVAAASMFDENTVDLITLDAIGDHLERLTVTAIGLKSVDGPDAIVPLTAQFDGVVQTMDPVDQARAEDFRDRDLANPPFQIERGLGAAGTLVISDDGDFATDSGTTLTRKLVLRRLNTRRGSIRHLPEFGILLAEKEPVSSGGDLQAILRDIEQQAEQEPDVVRAVAHGTLDRSGVAVIQLAIQPSGGATINMRMGAVHGRIVEL